jgi:uncharacterized RDD family membrane protein YckC
VRNLLVDVSCVLSMAVLLLLASYVTLGDDPGRFLPALLGTSLIFLTFAVALFVAYVITRDIGGEERTLNED